MGGESQSLRPGGRTVYIVTETVVSFCVDEISTLDPCNFKRLWQTASPKTHSLRMVQNIFVQIERLHNMPDLRVGERRAGICHLDLNFPA